MTTVYSPKDLSEVLLRLGDRQSELKILAGGTDLMVLMNARQLEAGEFLDIWGVDALRGIREEGDSVRIGALTTFSEIVRSPLVGRHMPSLVAASKTIGAIQIQNRGTIGGNVVNASPAGDSLPVLAAYDAQLELGSARRIRLVDFNHFYLGYRTTALAPDELLLAVHLPKIKSGERDFFWKVGTRRAQAISKTVMAVKATVGGEVIESISIGVGSVAPTVIRTRSTEALLTQRKISIDLIESARISIAGEVSPITDLRSNEHYRRTVTGNILARILRGLSKR
jgi:CO/xanthine dehydrogenase FAD-binding subunit